MTLKSFPRGGKKPAAKPNIGLSFGKKDASSKPRKNRGKRSQEGEPLEVEKNYLADTAECLNYSSLGEGMIVLGRIHETTEYDMIVSLPGRLSGRIQATDISESYTNLLRSIVKSENEKIDEFKPLSELYNRGKYVVCCVKSVTPGEKWRISLSLEPQLINRNFDPTRLRKGSKILGTISSVEDHGYVVDTGIDNFRCFLGVKDIDPGVTYHPGKQLFCAVKSAESLENSTTARLTTRSKHVTQASCNDDQSLDAQIPGTKLILTVQRILRNGLRVSFNNGNVGYVNRLYLDKPLESYEPDSVIHGILMYVMPTLKFAYFTLLGSDENTESLAIGDIIERARVSYIEGKGIVMSLKKGLRGIVPFRRTDVAYEKIASKFSIDTRHKCRVMAHDLFEQIYVCTMERELLDEKYFATSSLVPGQRLTVQIAKIQPETGYMMVTAGRTKGWVAAEQIRDPEIAEKVRYGIGDEAEARVLGPDKKQKGVLFTLKKSLIESELPILSDIADATIGEEHHGTIVRITSKGLLVRFYGNAKGWIPSRTLDRKNSSKSWNFMIGQVIKARIVNVKREIGKLTLSLSSSSTSSSREAAEPSDEINFEIGENIEGRVIEATTDGIYLDITRNPGEAAKIGFLPAGHMSPCHEIGVYLASRCKIGDTIGALVFSTKPRFLLTRTFVPHDKYRNFDKLKIGDCLPCSISEITVDGLRLVLPLNNYESYGIATSPNIENNDKLRINQILFARIVALSRKNRKISLATSLHVIMNDSSMIRDGDLFASLDVLSLYFKKLRELTDNDYYRDKPIARIKIGERIEARIEKVTEHGLVLRLDNDVTGTVRNDHYRGSVRPGDRVNGTIMWINYIHELAEITLLPNIINSMKTRQDKLPKISTEKQLRGDILLVNNWFVLVLLKGAGNGILAALPARRHINDLVPDLTIYRFGRRIRCYVVLNRAETEFLPICLLKSSFETKKIAKSPVGASLKRKSDDGEASKRKKMKITRSEVAAMPEEEKLPKKRKGKMEISPKDMINSSIPETEAKSSKKRKLKAKNSSLKSSCVISACPEVEKSPGKSSKQRKKINVNAREIVNDESVKFAEQMFSDSDENDTNETNLGIPECGFFWDNKPEDNIIREESSSDDEDDDDDDDDNENSRKKRKKKLSAAERREAERQKEREIREREEALASNEAPNSVDQFDRLVLSSPDNSMIWLRYMAHHLQATEVDKARAVAKRAIKTINFREETERLNVWRAWLNLESRFGSGESLGSVFQEAVRTNDSRAVYLHMLSVHADAGRQNELEKIVSTIVGKFKQTADVWHECGAAFLKIGLREKSRHIMQRALQSLPAQEHVNLMVKFAQMENKYGDKERARTLFEQVLTSYPKRVDVWSSYVDVLVKSENFDAARKVLEKAVVQTLPARKMKTLFKKFIDFEQKYGTPEGVSHVQELALKYVEKECNKEPV